MNASDMGPETGICASCGRFVRLDGAMRRDGMYWHAACPEPKPAASKPTMTAAEYAAAVAKLSEGVQASFTEMSRLRSETAIAKIPDVIDHLQSFVDANTKVIVFAHHHKVIDALAAAFPGISVVVDGRVQLTKRQANVDRFQTDPTCLVFIGEFQAAGVGWTLTAASNVVFAELDWVPGNLSQAEDRAHRIGQVNPVLAQHIVLQGSLDANMAHKLVAKQGVITDALDTKAAPVVPQPVNVAAPTQQAAQTAVPAPKPVITDPVIVAAIHQALQRVAGSCDGAHDLDGVGFNGTDTDFGRQLAAQDSISPRQAFVAAKMLLKYHKQVGAGLIAACKEGIAIATGQPVPVAQPVPAPKPVAPKPTPATPPNAQQGNPYKGGQKATCYDMLVDGAEHTWEEMKAINEKYPKDPAGFLMKDAAQYGWTIVRTKSGVRMERA